VSGLPRVLAGDALVLHRVPEAAEGPRPSLGRVTAVVAVHACWGLVVVGALLWMAARGSTVTLRRRPSEK
jgi:hypothetical protein